jgi:hypothetical protein
MTFAMIADCDSLYFTTESTENTEMFRLIYLSKEFRSLSATPAEPRPSRRAKRGNHHLTPPA